MYLLRGVGRLGRRLECSRALFSLCSAHSTVQFELFRPRCCCFLPLSTSSASFGKATKRNGDKRASFKRVNRRLEPLHELRENILTVPNLLTFSRIFCTPLIAYGIINESFISALGLLVFAGLTDLFDGYIARRFPSQASHFGTAIDPLADKFLVATLAVSLVYAGLLPYPLAGLMISRDVLLVSAVLFYRLKSLPAPRTLRRFFDPTLITGKLEPTTLSKWNTAVQLLLLFCTVSSAAFDLPSVSLLMALQWLTGCTTVLSALSYVFSKNTVQFVNYKRAK